MKNKIGTSLALLALGMAGTCQALTKQDVDNSFNPYSRGKPTYPGLNVGMTIGRTNVDQFKEVLAVGTDKIIKDGYFEMKIGATTDFMLPQSDPLPPRPGGRFIPGGLSCISKF
jgi:hypothetical protein